MIINGHTITVKNGTVTYRGRAYPLSEARATYRTQRRGTPGTTRHTEYEVTIDGDGWRIMGRCRPRWFPGFRPNAVPALVDAINQH